MQLRQSFSGEANMPWSRKHVDDRWPVFVQDCTARVWDVESGKALHCLEGAEQRTIKT